MDLENAESICVIKSAYCGKIYSTVLQIKSLVNLEMIKVSHKDTKGTRENCSKVNNKIKFLAQLKLILYKL